MLIPTSVLLGSCVLGLVVQTQDGHVVKVPLI